jgi:serine/threonine-protein kinase
MEQNGLSGLAAHSHALRYDRIIADRYHIVRLIGEGSNGAVFFAKDLQNRMEPCAIKLLKPDYDERNSESLRFRNESIIALGLSHPNLVSVVDISIGNIEEFFIVMEYIDGGTLRQVLNKEVVVGFDRALSILHQIACGLNHCHASKVVHRDLKPENILISENEVYKITDFGLAKSQDIRDSLTKTGETVGTPFYMAPEQYRGESPTRMNDIYSLGIMAFEMVSGYKPFRDENYVGLATMHLNHPLPRLSEYGTKVPKWFQELLESCTEKKLANRMPSIEEFSSHLEYHMDRRGLHCEERIASSTPPPIGFLGRISSAFGW